MQDIHDIQPPVMTGLDPELVKIGLWSGAGILVVLLIFFAVRYFLKNRKKRSSDAPKFDLIPPYDAAVKALGRLETGGRSDAKSFYFELGHIVKAYIGGTFGINCLEMTSQELSRAVKAIEILPNALKSDIAGFQDRCDPIRYAPLTAGSALEPAQTDLEFAKELIEQMETIKINALQKKEAGN